MKEGYNSQKTENGANVPVWSEVKHCMSFAKPVSVEEACSQVSFDYNVEKDPIIRVSTEFVDAIKNGDTKTLKRLIGDLDKNNIVKGKAATVNRNTNQTLGVVSRKYAVVQNLRGFDVVNWLTNTDKETPIVETIGTTNNGGRVYVTAKMPSEHFLDGDSGGFNMYAIFTNDHCGRSGLQVMFSPVRVVCTNTLNMAIRSAKSNRYVLRHTAHVNEKIDLITSGCGRDSDLARINALEVMGAYDKFKSEFVDTLAYLKKEKVNRKDMCEFVLNLCFKDKLAQEVRNANYSTSVVEGMRGTTAQVAKFKGLMESIENGFGQNEHRGSKLWLLNGLTNYYSNVKNYKDADQKFNSIMIGGGDYKESVKAMKMLTY